MDEAELQLALTAPASRQAAEEWVDHVVKALGPRFSPADGVGAYWLDDETQDKLETALASARHLLGDRVNDLVYRSASNFLDAIDLSWEVWARPASQPPPRLFMVERPDSGPEGPEPQLGLAFEDERGQWWMWEPTIDRFHEVTPGLATDFYYRARAQTREWIDEGFGRFRFTRLPIQRAVAMLDEGTFDSGGEKLMLPYLENVSLLTFAQAAQQIERAARAD